ncbi:MAG: Uma2 family endonuclease [Planctomycetaceae bacterium]
MATVDTKPLTAEEFFDWQADVDSDVRHELDRGEVIEMNIPGPRHGLVCMNVGWALTEYARRRGRGFVTGNDAGVIVERDPDTVAGPDVCYYDASIPFEDVPVRYSDLRPLVAVEVLSPSDRFGKVVERVNRFLTAGIRLVWVVDPDARNVTVNRAGRKPLVIGEHGRIVGDELLPDFDVPVADFFAVPLGPAQDSAGG